ncbi:F-box and associated interaction domains-containing protein [Rhynchospora pubera]|uniref:F-box and associated interaction domains-containing protein n=1 Tax=Rhynchospora pubera TaxID=906938 RepID=A0AAV8D666_9POAL|nr:F-box and associated interaction domains-containing protein [Rhynchospora pubera]KAJ4763970.1 F-box and associated interaction domains-containing protein [Rhynchospora pubera]KAJ4763972.1 F-box and associated interaction domains-containing protein [Rhynchospora pubera]
MDNPNHCIRNTNPENKGGRDSMPSDVLADILTRLPAKMITRLRVVNKLWESIPKNSSFIEAHLERAKKYAKPFLLLSEEDNTITLINTDTWEKTSMVINGHDDKFNLPNSCCDGLVCLTNKDDRSMILNPTTRECFMIPGPPIRTNLLELGFDSSSKVYKVLRVSNPKLDENYIWELLTVGSTLWREVGTTTGEDFFIGGIYVKGIVYWVAYKEGERSLLSFDFKEERLSSASASTCEPLRSDGYEQLLEVRGSLGMAITREDITIYSPDEEEYQLMEIWVMGDGINSWSKKYSLALPAEVYFEVLFLKAKKILLHNKEDNGLYYYDLENHLFGPKEFDLPRLQSCTPCVESLVTLKDRFSPMDLVSVGSGGGLQGTQGDGIDVDKAE